MVYHKKSSNNEFWDVVTWVQEMPDFQVDPFYQVLYNIMKSQPPSKDLYTESDDMTELRHYAWKEGYTVRWIVFKTGPVKHQIQVIPRNGRHEPIVTQSIGSRMEAWYDAKSAFVKASGKKSPFTVDKEYEESKKFIESLNLSALAGEDLGCH
ncbi:uncharacterized protein FOMMEDRAFT_30418 [Fomitiporia mediterranea MF3/22]|uniref:uncharacterized protein n=1 Tax=Fomitiporia mediterranea (strain MF3/22) TaxID=694068 RepID=UPI0004408CD5|nr:uncharacterized protein FOMMEDRAFT_30418 [Fomitiporia mediterranea MF3/22]EJD00345.1 hypothetical protein FOMMEDRAFT_30418 [Fomitiporia mediterranea MF3/22]